MSYGHPVFSNSAIFFSHISFTVSLSMFYFDIPMVNHQWLNIPFLLEIQGTYLVPSTILVGVLGLCFRALLETMLMFVHFSIAVACLSLELVASQIFIFTPSNGMMILVGFFSFSDGWLNHQPVVIYFPLFCSYSRPISLCKKTWAPLFHMFLTDIFPIVSPLWMAIFIHFPDISLIFPLYFPYISPIFPLENMVLSAPLNRVLSLTPGRSRSARSSPTKAVVIGGGLLGLEAAKVGNTMKHAVF